MLTIPQSLESLADPAPKGACIRGGLGSSDIALLVILIPVVLVLVISAVP